MLRGYGYSVNIAGGFGATQPTSDCVEANGNSSAKQSSRYTRRPDRRPILDMLMVSVGIRDVSFTHEDPICARKQRPQVRDG